MSLKLKHPPPLLKEVIKIIIYNIKTYFLKFFKVEINPNYLIKKNKGKILLHRKNQSERGFILDNEIYSIIKKLKKSRLQKNRLSPLEKTTVEVFKYLNLIKDRKNILINTPLIKRRRVKAQIPLSLVILNYNGKKHLKALLDSVLEQTYRNFEVIVIDNCSTDNSLKIIKRYKKLSIKLISLKNPKSFSYANNLGIKKAKNNFVLFLNNDLKLEKNCLNNLIFKTQKAKNWAAIALKMRMYYSPKIINSLGVSLKEKRFGYDNFLGLIDFGQIDDTKQIMASSFGAVLVKKDLFEKIGVLDDNYYFYYEDLDWCYRAQLLDYKILTCPEALVYHKFSGSSTGRKGNLKKIKLAIINRIYFVSKNFNKFYLKKFLKNYLIEDFLKFGVHLIKFRFLYALNYLKAYFELLKKITQILKKRKKINQIKKKYPIKEKNIIKKALPYLPLTDGNFVLLNKEILTLYYMDLFLKNKVRFGFLGYASKAKGFFVLLKVFEQIANQYLGKVPVELKIFGKIERPSFWNKRRINRLKERQIIKEFGDYKRKDLGKIFNQIDVLIIPSLWNELYGLVLDEAKLFKTPVIVSDKGALKERITDKLDGLVFNSQKKQDLMKKIEIFLKKPELIKNISRNIKSPKKFKKHSSEIRKIILESL
ncbi:MAG: glycosyltransferase [Candidatus Moranbacteria bacterium]|nr:glycosyltransferase [Candidatus Moranbacteria bacterium]